MKIRIESEPGELENRAHDVVRVIERLTGKALSCGHGEEDLEKAADQIKQTQAQFEYPVTKTAVGRGEKQAERIRKRMLRKLGKVLAEVR